MLTVLSTVVPHTVIRVVYHCTRLRQCNGKAHTLSKKRQSQLETITHNRMGRAIYDRLMTVIFTIWKTNWI